MCSVPASYVVCTRRGTNDKWCRNYEIRRTKGNILSRFAATVDRLVADPVFQLPDAQSREQERFCAREAAGSGKFGLVIGLSIGRSLFARPVFSSCFRLAHAAGPRLSHAKLSTATHNSRGSKAASTPASLWSPPPWPQPRKTDNLV